MTHNFSAGPGILPQEVLSEASLAAKDFNGMGLSLLEISHRSKQFMAVMDEAEALVCELLGLNDDYGVVFLTGGASTQFFMAPMNLLNRDDRASYIDTGVWASKAIEEAVHFAHIDVLASSKDSNYNYIPRDYSVPKDAKYLHITSNNTIFGSQYHFWPDIEQCIVCDMSSDMFSRPIPVEKFGLIYAGAQKNMGPAGTTLVIVRKDLLGKVSHHLPSMLDYRVHIKNGSMYNTPPVFPIYVSMLTMRWIKAQGGLSGIQKINESKAKIIYDEIDANPLFKGTVNTTDRSLMNACFVMNDPTLEKEFGDLAKSNGIDGIAGHRSVGGFRASIYNAMPQSSVQVLVDLMKEYAVKKG